MRRHPIGPINVTLLSAVISLSFSARFVAQEAPRYAGATEKGFLLPNGWTLKPAGEHVSLADLPLNIIPLPDNRHALAATSGYNAHELSLIDLQERKVVDHQTVRQSWFGLALAPAADRVWWSGGGGKGLHVFRLVDRQLSRTSGPEPTTATKTSARTSHFRTGLAVDARRKRIYSLDVDRGTITAFELETLKEHNSASAGARPYDVVLARNGLHVFVSDWAGRSVRVLDPGDLHTVARIAVGDHPTQIAVHPGDDRIFVACASSNCVSVIDTRRGIVTETINTALFPQAPEGSTPDALAVTPDGKMLVVANADNNNIAVIDIAAPGRSQIKGFIPTGWYPTSVAVTPDGRQLLIGVGKGLETKANPMITPNAKPVGTTRTGPDRRFPYIGSTLSGSLSVVAMPDDKVLAGYTETVYKNCPYSDKLLTDAPYPEKTAIPTKVGEPSPIRYVLYIIKENCTYVGVVKIFDPDSASFEQLCGYSVAESPRKS
jgi:DNA-binding beta-propeller fold protein YncE